MEILRHPGYLEIRLPDFFNQDARVDNLTRLFSAVQPGTHGLLLDLRSQTRVRRRDEEETLHVCRALVGALQAISIEVEAVALLVTAPREEEAKHYARLLEEAGFQCQAFSDRHKAEGWLGR